jgi:uncharacterized protein YjiS (DUF1127 family)
MKTLSQAILPIGVRHGSWWRPATRLIALWHRRAQERQELTAMDERELRDIGISRLDARREADKPFWRG